MTSKPTALWIRLWPVYVILLGLALALSQGWHEYLTLDALSANAVSLDAMVKENFLIVFAAYILIYAAATTFMVPGSALTIAGGPARRGVLRLGAVLRDVAGPFIEKMRAGFAENPVSYMFALRLIPIFPFAAVNIAPGLLGAKYRDYLLTTFFGIIPGTLAYTWIGAAVKGTLLEGGTPDIGSLAANFVPAFIALGLVSLLPVAYKKLFPKKVPA